MDGNTHLNAISLRKLLKRGIQRHPSLRRISLSSCNLNDDGNCMKVIISSLKSNNITHLDLSSNQFTSESVHCLLSTLRSGGGKCRLESLDLSYNKLGDEGMRMITQGLNSGLFPNLRELYLREIGASESVEALLAALSNSRASAITSLDISGNYFKGTQKIMSYSSQNSISKNFAAAAIKKLNVESKVQSFLNAKSIRGSGGMTTLSIKDKRNFVQRMNSLKALSKLLASSSPLRVLGLDRVGLEDKDCAKLYSILKKKMKSKARGSDDKKCFSSDGLKLGKEEEDTLTLTVNLNAGLSSEGLSTLDRALDVAASLRETLPRTRKRENKVKLLL